MLEKFPNENTIQQAVSNFVQVSKDSYITVSKIKQLHKDCNTTHKNCLSISYDRMWINFVVYKNAYLIVELSNIVNAPNTEYILKFDQPATATFFSEEFNWGLYTVQEELKKCDTNTFNYNEIEVMHDNHIYNIFITSCNNKDNYTIVVVDAKSRMVMFHIYKDNLMKNIAMPEYVAINRFNLSANKKYMYIEDLPENIRNAVIAQITLISLT
jgi:hypothetical protein